MSRERQKPRAAVLTPQPSDRPSPDWPANPAASAAPPPVAQDVRCASEGGNGARVLPRKRQQRQIGPAEEQWDESEEGEEGEERCGQGDVCVKLS